MRKWTDRGDESLEPRIAGFVTPHCWICNPAVPLRCSCTAAALSPNHHHTTRHLKFIHVTQLFVLHQIRINAIGCSEADVNRWESHRIKSR